jgi:hypothetical protein
MNTKIMNIALMAKWIWRIYSEQNPELLWLRLLKAKYNTENIFYTNPVGCSPFWHSIHKVKEHFKLGVRFHPGRNSSVSFWKDWWVGEEPLSVRFPALFEKSSNSDWSISQAYSDEGWRIPFRRNLEQSDLIAWEELCNLVDEIDLDDSPTRISWHLEPKGSFSTKSLYLELCKAPVVPLTKPIWDARIPLKNKIFTWQLAKGRLPSNDQILSRGGPSDGKCALCGEEENVEHIFFQCSLAKFMWSGVREMFSVNWNPSSRWQWFTILSTLDPKAKRLVWVYFAAQCWSLWTTRNKFTIEGKFPRQPADCVFKTILSLQLWRPIQSDKDRTLLDELISLARSFFASTYSTPPPPPS